MNYTTNYHLPQWDEADRIMRTDFNQMCADMEAGLTKTAADAAAANAKTAADAAAAASAAGSAAESSAKAAAAAAQATANKAVSDAAAAQAKADAAYSPSQPPYVVGYYRGTSAEQTISLGFKPRFLIVCNPNATYPCNSFLAIGEGVNRGKHLELADNGFKVYKDNDDPITSGLSSPILNKSPYSYVYIAFR